MRRLKNYILNLFGIEAIIRRGTPFIVFTRNGIIKAKGPSMFCELALYNLNFTPAEDGSGDFTITPKSEENK